jgi:hypothetical protein
MNLYCLVRVWTYENIYLRLAFSDFDPLPYNPYQIPTIARDSSLKIRAKCSAIWSTFKARAVVRWGYTAMPSRMPV